MTDGRADQVDRIFHAASRLVAERRRRYVDAACGDDAGLREAVEALLRAAEAADQEGFLDTALLKPDSPATVSVERETGPVGEAPCAMREAAPTVPGTVGPYRIVRTLGQGGMGVVYEAEHPATLARVALKTVTAGLMLGSIRREIHALARLRHPGVVKIVDEGVSDGRPWYAMEMVEGMPLDEHFHLEGAVAPTVREPGQHPRSRAGRDRTGEAWWTTVLNREPALPTGTPRPERPEAGSGLAADGRLPRALGLIRRLCGPLAYLHGEGLVHRDLKPQNVLVREDGTPVLVDFGLTAEFSGASSRERLQTKGHIAGTVAYMSPEQALGEIPDARSDIYSLGCMLYQLVTGRLPFQGAPMEVLMKHLEAAPTPPSRLVSGVAPELDALVLRLLAKRPRDRIGYATDLARALDALGSEEAPEPEAPPARSYLYRPGFVGRSDILGTLQDAIARVRSGSGSAVFLAGESGAGKTRLAVEASGHANEKGVRVLHGECAPVLGDAGAASHLGALRKPLRAIADECFARGPGYARRVVGERASVLAQYEPGMLEIPGLERTPAAPELDAEAARIRLWSYLAETLGELAHDHPVLLVVDDLQWADELTVGFVRFLLDGGWLDARRIMLLATYRREEASSLAPVLDRPDLTILEVGRLDEPSIAELVAGMLALDASPVGLARHIVQESEGNPFFVGELLRVAVDERLLYRDEVGSWRVFGGAEVTAESFATLPLPGSIRDLVLRRLERLSPRARGLVATASVVGREVSIDILARVARMEAADLLEALEEARRHVVLEEASPDILRFSHDKLREVAYGTVEGAEATHRDVALALLDSEDAAARQGEIGHHWERGGEVAKARVAYHSAARDAIAHHATDEAERLYVRYLGLVSEPTKESVLARCDLAERVLLLQGRAEEATAMQEKAWSEAHALGDSEAIAACARTQGLLLKGAGLLEESLSRFQEALTGYEGLCDEAGVARVMTEIASVELNRGNMDAAGDAYDVALELYRTLGDARGEGSVLANLAIRRSVQGRFLEAQELLDSAAACFRSLDDLPGEARSMFLLAATLQSRTRYDEARSLYERALRIFREVGDRRQEASVLSNLAAIEHEVGNRQVARKLHQDAIQAHIQIGGAAWAAWSMTNLAVLHHEEGVLDEARRVYVKALETTRSLGDRRLEAQLLANVADLDADESRWKHAASGYAEALGIHKETGDREGEGYALRGLARCHLERGEIAKARGRYDEALKILEEVGDARVCALVHLGQARLARWVGDYDAAESLAREAELSLAGTDDAVKLSMCAIERGHLALARGEPANDHLAAARSSVSKLGVLPTSELGRALGWLERTASEDVRPKHGEHPDRLPALLR